MTNKNCHVTIIISQSLRQNNIMGKFMPLFSPPFSPLFPPSSFPFSPLPFSPFLWFPPPPLSVQLMAGKPAGAGGSQLWERGGGGSSACRCRGKTDSGDTGNRETLRDTQKIPKRHLSGWWEGPFEKISSYQFWHRDTLQLDMGLQAQKRLRTEVSFLHYISFVTYV